MSLDDNYDKYMDSKTGAKGNKIMDYSRESHADWIEYLTEGDSDGTLLGTRNSKHMKKPVEYSAELINPSFAHTGTALWIKRDDEKYKVRFDDDLEPEVYGERGHSQDEIREFRDIAADLEDAMGRAIIIKEFGLTDEDQLERLNVSGPVHRRMVVLYQIKGTDKRLAVETSKLY